jgi:acetaldehyde dehydrogenase
MIMRDTIFCAIPDGADTDAIAASVRAMVEEVREYVPGYTLRADPQFDPPTRVGELAAKATRVGA